MQFERFDVYESLRSGIRMEHEMQYSGCTKHVSDIQINTMES